MLFSTYGPVLDVVALKTMKMRGQAHIVYRDIQTATQAMRSLDGFEFFGFPLVRQYLLSTRSRLTLGTRKYHMPSPSPTSSLSLTEPSNCLKPLLPPMSKSQTSNRAYSTPHYQAKLRLLPACLRNQVRMPS